MSPNFGFLKTSVRMMVANRLAAAGALIIVIFVLLALAAPTLTRLHVLHAPDQQDKQGLDRDGLPHPAGGVYLLGTDNLGRDVLSRVVYGARVSLSVGIAAMLTATVIGVAVGLLAGFYGGKLDLVLMRFTEMNMTVPAILLAIAFAGLLDVSGRTIRLHPAWLPWHFLEFTLKRGAVSVFLIVGFVCWPGMVRVIRAQVLALKEREFVLAARSLGSLTRGFCCDPFCQTSCPRSSCWQ
jgi:peptide/nickel transport system permease protein